MLATEPGMDEYQEGLKLKCNCREKKTRVHIIHALLVICRSGSTYSDYSCFQDEVYLQTTKSQGNSGYEIFFGRDERIQTGKKGRNGMSLV